jgi:hypothetical protein
VGAVFRSTLRARFLVYQAGTSRMNLNSFHIGHTRSLEIIESMKGREVLDLTIAWELSYVRLSLMMCA